MNKITLKSDITHAATSMLGSKCLVVCDTSGNPWYIESFEPIKIPCRHLAEELLKLQKMGGDNNGTK